MMVGTSMEVHSFSLPSASGGRSQIFGGRSQILIDSSVGTFVNRLVTS